MFEAESCESQSLISSPRDRHHSEMPKCFKEESSLQCFTNFFQIDDWAMATFHANDDCLQLLNHCILAEVELETHLPFTCFNFLWSQFIYFYVSDIKQYWAIPS